MKEITLETLFLGKEENFKERYKKLKKFRFFLADSVQDFTGNKNNLKTPLSDLFFLSKTRFSYIQFNDVKLNKKSDDIYDLGVKETGYTVKFYDLSDRSGETICVWPTRESKILKEISCERFEDMKKFNGNLLKMVSVVYESTTENASIYSVRFYPGKKQKKKEEIKELNPKFI